MWSLKPRTRHLCEYSRGTYVTTRASSDPAGKFEPVGALAVSGMLILTSVGACAIASQRGSNVLWFRVLPALVCARIAVLKPVCAARSFIACGAGVGSASVQRGWEMVEAIEAGQVPLPASSNPIPCPALVGCAGKPMHASFAVAKAK